MSQTPALALATPGVARTAPEVEPSAPAAAPTTRRRNPVVRLFAGSETDPAWARPALWGLLLVAAVTYLWNLTASGYANDFYAAAVKSSTQSWTAWLFGSLDSANAITVDKPPAALWVMGLSARLFGFSSFSLLLPQALMGVGTVALVAAAVRRWHGHLAGLVAGALVVATPVAALMFRFDNPDAMLTLLMAGAAYCVVRAIETSRGRSALGWMVAAGAAIGFAFLTKMLQGMLVLPGFVLAYLVAAPRSWKARIGHLLAALVSMVVSAGWFVVLVELWPASARPWIGGSTNNSEWELALGYNGLGRILGGSGNGGGGGGGGFGGTAGLLRMFNSQFGTEVSWFMPAALLLLVAGLVARGRAPRTDRVRASLVLWGGWVLSTGLVLSLMEGTVHSYYAIALVPGLAATIAVGGREMWERSGSIVWRTVLGLAVSVTAGWGFWQLGHYAAGWHSWIRWSALVLGVAAPMVFVGLSVLDQKTRWVRSVAVGALLVGSLAAAAPSVAWTAATISTGHTGSMPASGPASASTGGMGGGRGQMGTPPSGDGAPQGTAAQGTAQSGTGQTGTSQTGTTPTVQPGTAEAQQAADQSTSSQNGSGQDGQDGGMGGMGSSSNSELIEALNATSSTWSAAVIGDQTAAGYILDSDTAVMSIGGWSGTDENVTMEQFKTYVANGEITYFIAGGGMGGGQGGNGSASEITAWVQANYEATTIGGTTVYVLNS
ncbi:ArnT family glycosyltransferase [Luteococcus peritonei]|uniref:ArnT family glycosyltransferase n=1 Tax=Luteococcus peritonei TaxID=88874 RepID=A0ABW4RU77_9ACTN